MTTPTLSGSGLTGLCPMEQWASGAATPSGTITCAEHLLAVRPDSTTVDTAIIASTQTTLTWGPPMIFMSS